MVSENCPHTLQETLPHEDNGGDFIPLPNLVKLKTSILELRAANGLVLVIVCSSAVRRSHWKLRKETKYIKCEKSHLILVMNPINGNITNTLVSIRESKLGLPAILLLLLYIS
jgi:hypothetical protein